MRTGHEPTIKFDERTGLEPCLGGLLANDPVITPSVDMFIDGERVNFWNLLYIADYQPPDWILSRENLATPISTVNVSGSFVSNSSIQLKCCEFRMLAHGEDRSVEFTGRGAVYGLIYDKYSGHTIYEFSFDIQAWREVE